MRQQEIVPVYMLMGFLESGKTTMIHSMLTDEGFSGGQSIAASAGLSPCSPIEKGAVKKSLSNVASAEWHWLQKYFFLLSF